MQYYYSNKYYPWSFAYKKRIRVNIQFNEPKKILQETKNSIIRFTGNHYIKDTIILFSKNDQIIFSKQTNLNLQNSTIVFSGNISTANDFIKLNLTGDSLSTIIFSNSNINLNNTHFTGFGNRVKIKNRDVTAGITFSNSKINIKKSSFRNNYSGDDLVNVFRSVFIFDDIRILNAKSDGIDFDFSKGSISNSTLTNCGNDGIDIGSSSLLISNTSLTNCNDKGISIGEQSNVRLHKVDLYNNEIGIALKDYSSLSINAIITKNNHLDLAAYGKKGMYGPSRLSILDSSFNKLTYLIEPEVILPKSINVKYTNNIINLMYGKKYGKASVR
jgi:hypothetical protein